MRIEVLPAAAHEFLAGTRLATIVRPGEPFPHAVPVWFDWTGESIEFFSRPDRPKVRALRADPRISVVVSAEVAEPVYWVRIDGEAEVTADASALVERLCDRYLEAGDDSHDALRADLLANAAACVKVTVRPTRFHHFVS